GAVILAVSSITGCTSETGSPGRVRIAVIPKGTTHEFWQMVEAGVRKAEAELRSSGADIEVLWNGPLTEGDVKLQIDLVQNFISRGVQGIALAPVSDSALVQPVRDARSAGLPVVIFDSGLVGEAGKDFASYVATDNRQGGVLAARRLAEVLGGKGRVILLRYQVASESTSQREEGFLSTLASEFPEIEVISSDQYADDSEEKAFQKSQNLLTRFRDQVDGIFCPNESSTAGMLGALNQADLAGKVKFVGFDSSEKLIRALRDGRIDGLVLQNPTRMGYEATRVLVRVLRNEEVPLRIDTGVTVATPDNVDDPSIVEFYAPSPTPTRG
ncbi:MAG TPA: substrate-binding domain-containing protein, partial [Planctomycetota bacterium]|nr:substrate-binding domain-containing protein [Planctomycetota bacterium]